MTKKDIVQVRIVRQNGNSTFEFEVSPEIENAYKRLNPEIKESKSWAKLRFYYLPDLLSDETYLNALERYGLFDDFGTGLFRGNTANIAWVRTVGGKGKIQLPANIPFAQVSQAVEKTIGFLREYFQNYLQDYDVKGRVELNIEKE